MDRVTFMLDRGFKGIALGAVVMCGGSPAWAAPKHHMVFLRPTEAHGLGACLASNHPCAKAIADTWCKAHGRTASIAVGFADDVTGTSFDLMSPKLAPGSFIVDCGI